MKFSASTNVIRSVQFITVTLLALGSNLALSTEAVKSNAEQPAIENKATEKPKSEKSTPKAETPSPTAGKAATPTLQETVANINQTLPIMVDKETQLEVVTLAEESMFYSYKLVNVAVENINVSRFKSMMEANLKTAVCNDEASKGLLNQVKSLNYLYRDKDDKPVAKITIYTADCF